MKPTYEQLAAAVLAAGPTCDNCEGPASRIMRIGRTSTPMICHLTACQLEVQAYLETALNYTGPFEWMAMSPLIVALGRLAHELRSAGATHVERTAAPPPLRQTSASTDEPKPPPKAPAESADDASIRFSLLELD